jgi:hypothetical protein
VRASSVLKLRGHYGAETDPMTVPIPPHLGRPQHELALAIALVARVG